MNTKLTLTIEKSVIEKAKDFAEKNGQSLSHVVENYLRSVTQDSLQEKPVLTPVVKSLKGSITPPKKFDYKKELQKALQKKYLSDE